MMQKFSIYHALGMSETASEQEACCALRQMLRENYKKTRDNFGALEESLRFYNQACQILNDPQRRKVYDREWSLSQGSAEQRIDYVVQKAAGVDSQAVQVADIPLVEITGVVDLSPHKKPILNLELVPENAEMDFRMLPPEKKNQLSAAALVSEIGVPQIVFQEVPVSGIEVNIPATSSGKVLTDGVVTPQKEEKWPSPAKQHYHPVLTEALGQSRSPVLLGVFCALVLVVVAALLRFNWDYVVPSFDITQSWIWGVLLLVGFFVYTYGFRQGTKRAHKNYELPGEPDSEIIKNWRRKHTVFLGSNYLVEDPSWVFQLRLTELERARVQRSSYIRPWRRALARIFDYALWGWLLVFPLSELANRDIIPASVMSLVENPLIIPIVITATWIPIEALLMAAMGTTLGKWLFGVFVQFRVSNPYVRRDSLACWRYALARAFRVWWQGVALGFLPILALSSGRAKAALERFEETDWDDDYDVLVTHTPGKVVPFVVGLIGLTVLSLLYIGVWQRSLMSMGVHSTQFISTQIERWQQQENQTTPIVSGRHDAVSDPVIPVVPVSPELSESERRLVEFREAIMRASEESRTLLERKEWERALESCQRWAKLEITNPAPLRCQGDALQAMGKYQEAINAYRNAKLHAPEDRSIDEAIQRSQEEIFRQLNR